MGWCQHHDPLFLPWHRAYLYWLELALQSEAPDALDAPGGEGGEITVA